MSMMLWISFDLGVSGDYQGMYTWLDNHAAKECGDSVALLLYDPSSDSPYALQALQDPFAALRTELQKNVQLTSSSRVYVIYGAADGNTKGTWLVGGRKQAPWTGYGSLEGEGATDEP